MPSPSLSFLSAGALPEGVVPQDEDRSPRENRRIQRHRDGRQEIARSGKSVVALEVKSSRRKESLPGLAAFGKLYPAARKLTVGDQGIPLEEFLLTPAPRLIG